MIADKIAAMEPKMLIAKDVLPDRYAVKFDQIARNRTAYPVLVGGRGAPLRVLNLDVAAHLLSGGRYRTFAELAAAEKAEAAPC